MRIYANIGEDGYGPFDGPNAYLNSNCEADYEDDCKNCECDDCPYFDICDDEIKRQKLEVTKND